MCTIVAARPTTSIAARDNGVAVACEVAPSSFANILILDADVDCADALEMFLDDLPGGGQVRSAATVEAGLTLLEPLAPAVVFIDRLVPHELGASLHATLTAIRVRVPHVAIVVLCLYPLREHDGAHRLADGCVPKDTSYHELRAITSELLGLRAERGVLGTGNWSRLADNDCGEWLSGRCATVSGASAGIAAGWV